MNRPAEPTEKTAKAESPLTPAAGRAIGILVENPGVTARAFGHLMWPGHWAHEQWAGKREAGVAQGRAMWLKAGSYLWHLKRKGLVHHGLLRSGHGAIWYATEEGERLLEDAVERRQIGKEHE